MSRLNVCINNSNWKTFEEVKPESEIPYWFKMENGNIVLAAYINNGLGSIGWAKCLFNEDNELVCASNSFYILKKALLQPAMI